MKLYYCDGMYFAKQSDANRFARELAKTSYSDILVLRAEVATSRDNVLRMLNQEGGDSILDTDEPVYVTRGRLKGRLAK